LDNVTSNFLPILSSLGILWTLLSELNDLIDWLMNRWD